MKTKFYSLIFATAALLFAGCSDDDPVENGGPGGSTPGTDPTEYVDLSKNGTANSYIVNAQGAYEFDATAMGNGISTEEATALKMKPATVELLWQDAVNLVSGLKLEEGKVRFTASGEAGNAAIAVKDASGTVLWSWHIWSTGYNPDAESQSLNGVKWMDRNLGAATAQWDEAGKVKGLVYQWGRKDPFPALEGWTDNDAQSAVYDINGKKIIPFTTEVVTGDLNLNNAIQHPTVYYGGVRGADGKGPYDWYTTEDYTQQNDYLWEAVTDKGKTLYDPCPPGWRVPKSSAFYGLDKENLVAQGENGGRVHETIGYFPASGMRGFEGGIWTTVGVNGDYWSSTADTEGRVRTLHFIGSNVNPRGRNYRAAAMPVRCVSETQSGDVPEPGIEYDIDIQADRAIPAASAYLAKTGSDGSSNYYVALANVSFTMSDLNGTHQYIPEKSGELIFLDLYAANSEDEDYAIIPDGTYELSPDKKEGKASNEMTFSRYRTEDDGEIKHRFYKSGNVKVELLNPTNLTYKIEAELTSREDESVHLIYEGEVVLVNRGESSIKTVIVNPVDETFELADAIYQHTAKDGYDRYSINLYKGEMNGGGVLTDGYCMHIDLFQEAVSSKEHMELKPGVYTCSDEMEKGHYLRGQLLNLMGVPLYYGTYCQEVRPTNEAVLYGFAVKGTIEVKKEGEQYEFIVDITTPEGISIKGIYPMGDVTFIDKSPEMPGGDWLSLLKEDKTLNFNPTDDVYAYGNDYGAYTYLGATEFEIICNNRTSNESFYLHFLAEEGVTSPAGTYTVAKDPKNPKPGEFIPGSMEFDVLKDTWCYVKWEDGAEVGGAPATEGTLTIVDNGDNNYTITYEMKDDAEPRNTVKASWTGKVNLVVRAE